MVIHRDIAAGCPPVLGSITYRPILFTYMFRNVACKPSRDWVLECHCRICCHQSSQQHASHESLSSPSIAGGLSATAVREHEADFHDCNRACGYYSLTVSWRWELVKACRLRNERRGDVFKQMTTRTTSDLT